VQLEINDSPWIRVMMMPRREISVSKAPPQSQSSMKNRIKQQSLAAASLAILASASQAAVLAQYDFTTALTASSIGASTTGVGVTAGSFAVTLGNYSSGIGISTAGNSYLRSQFTGVDSTAALADTDYFSVTISASNIGETLDLSSVTFLLGTTHDNTTSFTTEAFLQSSVGGFGTGNPTITGSNTTRTSTTSGFNGTAATFDLTSFSDVSSITFQIRFADNLDQNGKLTRIDDFTLNGTVVPEPSTALLGGLGMLALLRRRR
jgi:hypothetical protein